MIIFIETLTRFHPSYVLSSKAYHTIGTLSNRVLNALEQKLPFMVTSKLFRTPVFIKSGNLLDTVNGAICCMALALVPVVAY